MSTTCCQSSTLFIHPSALCETRSIGDGTRIWPFAHVMDGAVIGRQCNIGGHAFVENGAQLGDHVTVKNHVMIWNGVTIEDDVFLGPGMMFTNDRHPRSARMEEVATKYRQTDSWLEPTIVRRGASIGAGAVILAGVTIGHYASIGAGAVVTHDVANHSVVIGQPARPVGWACTCGLTLDETLRCGDCDRRYHLQDGSRLTPQ